MQASPEYRDVAEELERAIEELEHPQWLQELERKAPRDLQSLLHERDGAAQLATKLPARYPPQCVAEDTDERRIWELIGLYYKNNNRFFEALAVFASLYDHMLAAQENSHEWVNKGMPLVWMSDCYWNMRYPVLAKRYRMLTLCEDAIRDEGALSLNISGAYFRLLLYHGLPDADIKGYAKEMYEWHKGNLPDGLFPEWVLGKLDSRWMTEIPAPEEGAVYSVNKRYVKHLLSKLGDSTGEILEQIAEYLLSCMPGCRTYRRRRTWSSDYDVVCSMEGFEVDFRSEFGRYFVCECKDWKEPADFPTMAKFCYVLDSTKSRFGILFSKMGISGAGRTVNAERAQLKVFQDRGIVIVVVDLNDLQRVAAGENFITLLRAKYEKVRLDLV